MSTVPRLILATCLTVVVVLVPASCDKATTPEWWDAVSRINDAALIGADTQSADWLSYGRTYSEGRYSPLRQITDGNVRSLGLVSATDVGAHLGIEATPLVVDGIVFTTGAWSVVYAIDALSGSILWKWDPAVDRSVAARTCCGPVNRGVALYRGKIYVGVLDGRLAALDARTGRAIWVTRTTDANKPYSITGAPRVVAGRVIIGNGGADLGVRGYISAYDAANGRLLWRTFTVPGDPSQPFESAALKKAAATWTGEWWKYGGGGTAWDAIAYDPELGLLYVGTGNGGPWDRKVRSPGGGDNLFLSCILALRPATGDLVWYYQTTPGDSWDYTATQQMILADIVIQGSLRKVLIQAPKNGFAYVLDRQTGELLSAKAYTRMTWSIGVDPKSGRPIENAEARYDKGAAVITPSPWGAHSWQAMSFNPRTGLVYIPVDEITYVFARQARFEFHQGALNPGAIATADYSAEPPRARLIAWDPSVARIRWEVRLPDVWNGGTLTTAGNLVFQGTADGRFVAYRADSGTELWAIAAGSGIVAPPVTFQVRDRQYVAVMTGWGGGFALGHGGDARWTGPGRLLVFALEGKGNVVPERPPKRSRPERIATTASAAMIDSGAALFEAWCAACHGSQVISATAVPDLRYSTRTTINDFISIVLDGARAVRGMPSFERWLSARDVDAIEAYVVARRQSAVP